MPSTIAILYRQRLGRHALNDHHGQWHLSAMQMSPHAGQRLCTGDLGSKSHDCFFHVFHSLTSKEPFPCPAAWKIFVLLEIAFCPQMHSNNECVVFPEHLPMGPKLHSVFKLLISVRLTFPTIVKQPLHCIDHLFLCQPILPFFRVCGIIRTEILDTLGSHVAPNPTSSPMGTPFLQIQIVYHKNSLVEAFRSYCGFFIWTSFTLPANHSRTTFFTYST